MPADHADQREHHDPFAATHEHLRSLPTRAALSIALHASPLELGSFIDNDTAVPQVEPQLCVTMLKALADETRWSIVRELLRAPHTVGELSESLDVSHYNVSKHLRILRHAGIIATEKKGKTVECRVAESFRKKLSKDQAMLDFGCCTFRFKPK
jgi:DNA-binding HxlR family transcriptional regulator